MGQRKVIVSQVFGLPQISLVTIVFGSRDGGMCLLLSFT